LSFGEKLSNRLEYLIKVRGINTQQLYQLLIVGTKSCLHESNYKTEIIPFTDNYKNLAVVTQIRMNYKNNSTHVNFKDQKSFLIAKKY
jgi:hypothetical protein